ncbi:hypothetical protein JW835_14395 [bacterium]|nr:hypothetical protein [bacterium]
MLSIRQCKAILEKNGRVYSETQIKALRELLYQLGEIDYNHFKDMMKNAEKSHHLQPSFN